MMPTILSPQTALPAPVTASPVGTPDGSGTAYSDGATIADVQNDITLYAQWSYNGGKGSGFGKSGTTKTKSAIPAGGVPAVNNGIITTSTGTFVTDTTTDVHVRGSYTVRLTSDNG